MAWRSLEMEESVSLSWLDLVLHSVPRYREEERKEDWESVVKGIVSPSCSS